MKKRTKDNFYVPAYKKFLESIDLTLQEKAFYLYICSHGNCCFKTQDVICKELSISKPTLHKLMKSLERKGFFYIQRKFGTNTKEKATPNIFPIPCNDTKGYINRDSSKSMIDYFSQKYPSDY